MSMKRGGDLSESSRKRQKVDDISDKPEAKESEVSREEPELDTKVFSDPIHGHIELHPVLVKIIDTPQFQRLRHIRQLGGVYLVFPGASHNRFEHSIGVGYLAGKFVNTLRRKQKDLDISDKDVLCVEIAGLCHDLGHGPFSHLYDGQFIPKFSTDQGGSWKHEKGSEDMLDHMLEVNTEVREAFEKFKINDEDITFIKEMIQGPKGSDPVWPYLGRKENKSFLYEIVSNKITGIDVDKWDYFARDSYHLGIPNSFDMGRCMEFSRVIEVEKEVEVNSVKKKVKRRQICSRDKEIDNLYEMFHIRSSLHRRVYQHKTKNIIEYMITEALCKANEHFGIPGKDGTKCKMSDAIKDPYAFTRLTDSVLQEIMNSTDTNLKEAQEILKRIECRKLYAYIGYVCVDNQESVSEDDISGFDNEDELKAEDIVVETVTFDYGMKDNDPVKRMRFFKKKFPNVAEEATKSQISRMLPSTFREKRVRIYCKNNKVEAAHRAFGNWCNKKGLVQYTPKKS